MWNTAINLKRQPCTAHLFGNLLHSLGYQGCVTEFRFRQFSASFSANSLRIEKKVNGHKFAYNTRRLCTLPTERRIGMRRRSPLSVFAVVFLDVCPLVGEQMTNKREIEKDGEREREKERREREKGEG